MKENELHQFIKHICIVQTLCGYTLVSADVYKNKSDFTCEQSLMCKLPAPGVNNEENEEPIVGFLVWHEVATDH